jgi:hypothetical protein
VESITDPLFRSLNDVVAVGRSSFYVTNDHNCDRYLPLLLILDVFEICTGNVVYYGNSTAKIEAEGLCFPNGINAKQGLQKVKNLTRFRF